MDVQRNIKSQLLPRGFRVFEYEEKSSCMWVMLSGGQFPPLTPDAAVQRNRLELVCVGW